MRLVSRVMLIKLNVPSMVARLPASKEGRPITFSTGRSPVIFWIPSRARGAVTPVATVMLPEKVVQPAMAVASDPLEMVRVPEGWQLLEDWADDC